MCLRISAEPVGTKDNENFALIKQASYFQEKYCILEETLKQEEVVT